MSNSKGQGWFEEPGRHALAARGIPTAKIDEAKACKVAESFESYKDIMNTTTGTLAMQKLVSGLDDDMVAKGKKWDKFKEKVKDFGGKAKEKAKEMGSKIKEKTSDVKEKLEDYREELKEKDNEKVGDVLKDEIENKDIEKIARTPEQRAELESMVEDGSSKELVDAIRSGEVIDSNAFEVTGQNAEELAEHLSNLKKDVKELEEKKEIMKDYLEERERYIDKEYKIDKDEISQEWREFKESNDDKEELARKKNELKQEKKMSKLDYQMGLLETKAEYDYVEEMYGIMRNLYKDRKKFIGELIK